MKRQKHTLVLIEKETGGGGEMMKVSMAILFSVIFYEFTM